MSLFADFFPLYSKIVQKLGYSRFKVGGHKGKKLRYPGDTELIAKKKKKKENLQQLIDIDEEKRAQKKGVATESKKTDVIVIN